MTPEELTEAKDKLLDRIEEFLVDLAIADPEEAKALGVGNDLRDEEERIGESWTPIEDLLGDIQELRSREEIAAVIAAGKKVGR